MERVAPSALNYDNILPLAIESRSNRREFRPNNGASFSNNTGATHIRIDVNADSMLDPLNSYLEVTINNETAGTFLGLAPFGPAFIQRLRIESGGVVIEDIDEYSRLYAMTSLCQCPKDYLNNNYNAMGMYQKHTTSNHRPANTDNQDRRFTNGDVCGSSNGGAVLANPVSLTTDLEYPSTFQCKIAGFDNGAVIADNAANRPTASALINHAKLPQGQGHVMCIPLLSGFLNMDKYIPLIMMNAGFTIDIELVADSKIGCATTETAAAQTAVSAAPTYAITNVKYVAHLIDLDRGFYDRLRAVMEGSGGVLQLAGQTYRHYVGQIPANTGPHTITLPARVKSVKSIFATFHDNATYGAVAGGYSQSVFQNAQLNSFRFEIGSVRYPQNDIQCRMSGVDVGNTAGITDVGRNENCEFLVELQKAFGKLGDYSHQLAFDRKNLMNVNLPMTGGGDGEYQGVVVSSYVLGYDFEAFQRVALEAGINTADRSLPINFICERYQQLQAGTTRADFYVLTDAIYYINLDGTVSVSV